MKSHYLSFWQTLVKTIKNMSKNRRILAKSSSKSKAKKIYLSDHIKDVMKVFDIMIKALSINDERLIKLLRTAIVLHDSGKVLPYFQIRTLKNKTYLPNELSYNLPHSIFSLFMIDYNKLKDTLKHEHDIDILCSAIAYHHWHHYFNDIVLQPNNESIHQLVNSLLDEKQIINKLEMNLKKEIRRIGGDYYKLVGFNERMTKGLLKGLPFYYYAVPPYGMSFHPFQHGAGSYEHNLRTLVAGLLQLCDHIASFCESERENIRNVKVIMRPPDYYTIKDSVKNIIDKKNRVTLYEQSKPWQFAAVEHCKDDNVILVAPTGYGKTEFAFLWSGGDRFFYTLPLRAAVNQIYERACAVFNREKCGILHSDADLFLLNSLKSIGNNLKQDEEMSIKVYDISRQLIYPVNISTGDQIFPYALRPPGYEKIYALLSYSRLIIDEVQAYNPVSAAIIIKLIKDIVNSGGKFLIITATLPEFIKREIDSIKNIKYNLVNVYENERNKLEAIKKHNVNIELMQDNEITEEKLLEVINHANKGKRVLVIANTVKQAQNIFSRLKSLITNNVQYSKLKDKLWLLHSRFTLSDRSFLENKICGENGEFRSPKPGDENDGKIFVSTQVVEASLDIDADVLFTEIAPADSLAQRMGRVLRRYNPSTPVSEIPQANEQNVYVWVLGNDLQSGKEHVYDPEILLITLKVLKCKSNNDEKEDIKEWVKEKLKLLKNKNKEEEIKSILEDIFTDKQSSFSLLVSEYDKYDIVKTVYELLTEESSYLSKFYQAKEIVGIGYESNDKKEANKIFREVNTASTVPMHYKEKFFKEAQDFFNKYRNKKVRKKYTLFKNEIISRFVVDMPYSVIYNNRYEKFKDIELEDLKKKLGIHFTSEEASILKNWCRDIIFVDYEYDNEIGAVVGRE